VRAARGVWGISASEEPLLKALDQLRLAGYSRMETFAPIPSEKMEQRLGAARSPVRYYTLAGGILGFAAGMALTIQTSAQWPLMTGGKPIVSLPPFLVIGFELTILLGGLFTLAGLVIHGRLGRKNTPAGIDRRLSDDQFGILVHCREVQILEVQNLLLQSGVEEISIEAGS
jgi:hypothetical protein